MIHIIQLGLTSVVDTKKLRDGELGQLLETLTTEATTRSQPRREHIDINKKEVIKFLTKCRSLIQTVISGPTDTNTDKPLEKAYHLFENVVSTLQIHLQNIKEDQKEETSKLLRQQYTTF